jgi:hypothetical protein
MPKAMNQAPSVLPARPFFFRFGVAYQLILDCLRLNLRQTTPSKIIQNQDRKVGMCAMSKNILPSGPHKSSLETTLTVLDEALVEFEAWANGHQISSVLYRELNGLSEDQRGEILIRIQGIRRILTELRAYLGLRTNTNNIVRSISGQCSALWASLTEIESRHLRRYGVPPDGLAEYLDPNVTRLIDLISEISRIAVES